MAFFPREETVRHIGKKMTLIDTNKKDHLLPSHNWEQRSSQNATAMEKADEALFNRILGDSDAPHKGKRTGSMYKKREEVNLFLPYGSAPPPPAKPPNVQYHDEDYYKQFVHDGAMKHRLKEEQKIIDAPSSFDRNFSRNAVDQFYNPNEKYGEDQALTQLQQKYGHRGHGLLDDLVKKDSPMKHEGKKIAHDHIGRGVLTPDPNPIPGFVGVGMGNHEHLAAIKSKATTPTPVYDPLGLKAMKDAAKEKLRATSTTPSHVFENEYGVPSHLARKDFPCHAKTLMTHNPREVTVVPVDGPRCMKHFDQTSPIKEGHAVINGFDGIGKSCTDGGVPRMTGLKHCTPNECRPLPAPHRNTTIFQAHQEAYRR